MPVQKLRLSAWILPFVCVAGLISWVGCSSTEKTATGGFASVVISGNTPGQIRDVAVAVFGENGYKTVDSSPDNLVFEKQGSHMNNFVYGSWLSDEPVYIRVKAAVLPAGEMRSRLECRAYMVRDAGGSTEEQLNLSNVHKGTYQKLLDEVAKRLAPK